MGISQALVSALGKDDGAIAPAESTHAQVDASARTAAGNAAVHRIADDETETRTLADGSVQRMVCGVAIVAQPGVAPEAIDKCATYVTAEIGANEYARDELRKMNTKIVIIPAQKRMTDIAMFAGLVGKTTPDARPWEGVRGSGGMRVPDGSFALAVPEENLIDVASPFQGYGTGYSVGMHELAHTLKNEAMTPEQHRRVDDLYAERKEAAKLDPDNLTTWTDLYASTDVDEYFAQATNCYFGKNAREGRNSRSWLAEHDPRMYAFLTDLYGHQHDKLGGTQLALDVDPSTMIA